MEETTEEKVARPQPSITAKQYWEDMKVRWGIHRYEWHEASEELRALAGNVNRSEWYNTLKKVTISSYHTIKNKITEVAALESTPAGTKVEESSVEEPTE